MPDSLPPPGETPPVEGSTAEAHPERPDGGPFEHPRIWLALILVGCALVAAYFLVRMIDL